MGNSDLWGVASTVRAHPRIIQGGMGVAVSDWRLARAVSMLGQLGVVSGTALAVVLARRLQWGDPEGGVRRALARFPIEGVASRILDRHFVEGGKGAGEPFRLTTMPTASFGRDLTELTVAGNFVEVYLAKEGHGGLVGINYLEKLQTPTLASLFGAMLAGVDYVLMGAGVPRAIPGVLDGLAAGSPVRLKLDVAGGGGESGGAAEVWSEFDPGAFCGTGAAGPVLWRPRFLAIVSSATLATALARKSSGRVDGFVVEGSTAGGHNAPPRGPLRLNDRGEPLYGEADEADLSRIAALGLPFWLAGSYGAPGRLGDAERAGAAGIQVGTAFAFCEESGVAPALKRAVIDAVCEGRVEVRTAARASPTGFPFKVAAVPGTVSDDQVYRSRARTCDLGYLRSLYAREDGSVGYRCPAEPEEQYVAKGGSDADAEGRVCLCNALLTTVGLGQVTEGGAVEPAVVTAGDDLVNLGRFLAPGKRSYRAADVVISLLEGAPA